MAEYTIDEGVKNGIRTKVHFEDGQIIHEKTFDAEPLLAYAKHAREATEGQRWGDGKLIGTIPNAVYAQILQIPDPDDREKAIMAYFRENTAFLMFDRALK